MLRAVCDILTRKVGWMDERLRTKLYALSGKLEGFAMMVNPKPEDYIWIKEQIADDEYEICATINRILEGKG